MSCCHGDAVLTLQLQDTATPVQSPSESSETMMTGEQQSASATPAAVDAQQSSKAAAAAAGKKHKSSANTPEPDTADERKAR